MLSNIVSIQLVAVTLHSQLLHKITSHSSETSNFRGVISHLTAHIYPNAALVCTVYQSPIKTVIFKRKKTIANYSLPQHPLATCCFSITNQAMDMLVFFGECRSKLICTIELYTDGIDTGLHTDPDSGFSCPKAVYPRFRFN